MSVEAGAGATLVKLVASALGVTAIAAIALFRGTGGRTGSDFLCLALTCVGVGGWSLLDDPLIGLAVFMIADIAAAVPTHATRGMTHARKHPNPGSWDSPARP